MNAGRRTFGAFIKMRSPSENRRALFDVGYATFLILALILLPLPHTFWFVGGIYCPYL